MLTLESFFLLNEIKMQDVIVRANSKGFLQAVMRDDPANVTSEAVQRDARELMQKFVKIVQNSDIVEQNKPLALQWAVSYFIAGKMSSSMIDAALRIIEKYFQFQKYASEKNLMNIKSFDEMNKIIQKAHAKHQEDQQSNSKKNKIEKLKKEMKFKVLQDDAKWKIVIPENEQAAIILGLGTKWCTATLDHESLFNHYSKLNDPLFIILDKSNNQKYQVHFGSGQFMDAEDRPLKGEFKKELISLLMQFKDKVEAPFPKIVNDLIIMKYADLRGADLRGADLQGADLQGAYLRGADLRDADLRGAVLQGADLRGAAVLQGANLQGVNLQGADLWGADLQGADLQGAYLRGADLRDADLRGAVLQGADLRGAYLQRAVLRNADLRGAVLQGANLQGVNLQGADLWGADLQGADLQGADLQGAYLRGAKNLDKAYNVPQEILNQHSLKIESFFQPELPSQANRHKFRSSMKNVGVPTFPFVDPKADEKFQENPALGSSGVSETEMEEGAMFNTEPISPPESVTDIGYSKLKGGSDVRRMNNRDLISNLSIRDFYDDDVKNNERMKNQNAKDSVKVMNVNEVGERYKMPTDIITTKQGFKNGLAVGNEPWRAKKPIDQEEDCIDDYINGVEQPNLRTLMPEWQSDAYEKAAASKKVKGPKSDLAFMDDVDNKDQPFLMVPLEDFKEQEEDDDDE